MNGHALAHVFIWLLKLPLWALATAFAVVLAPFAAAVLACAPSKPAPAWLAWMSTPDNLPAGDLGHRARWARVNDLIYRIVSRVFSHRVSDAFAYYPQTLAWLLRNRIYGFSSAVLGAPGRKDPGTVVHVIGNPRVSNRPLREGVVWRYTDRGAWQLYAVKLMPWGRCLRVNLGYKLWDAPGDPLFGSYTVHVSLTMGYSTR